VLVQVLACAALVLAMWKLRTIVAWMLAALLLAGALEPSVQRLMRWRFKRGWAVFAVFGVMACVLAGMIAAFVPSVVAQGRELIERGPELLAKFQDLGPVRWAEETFHVSERFSSGAGDSAEMAAKPAIAVASGVLHGVTGFITIIVLAVFVLLFGEEVLDGVLGWFAPERRKRAKSLAVRMRKVVSSYFVGTMMVACVGGVVMSATLAVLGVPYFLPLGLVMIVLGIIPVIGTTIAAVVLVGVTFATKGMTAALIAAGVYLVYQQVENHVLLPIVQKRALRMNPLVIVLALLVGTGLAGVYGAVMALPIAGALQVLLEDVRRRRGERVPERRVRARAGTE
jgi:putative heme transporter